jgi:GAF domain-containing protein
VLKTVTSTLDLDEVVRHVMQALRDVFEFDQLSIFLYNAQKQVLELTNWYGDGADDQMMARFVEFPLSIEWEEVYFIKAFLDNEPKYVSPITPKLLDNYYCERDRQMFEWNRHHAILICPLEVQEKVIGVINFVDTKKPFRITEQDIGHIQRYVAQIASTINNAYLARKNQYALALSREKEREVAHLNQVLQTTNATLDFDEVFAAISTGLRDIFQFEAVAIQLLNRLNGQLNVYKVYGDQITPENVDRWRRIPIYISDKESVSSYVFHTREPFYFPRVGPDAPLAAVDRKIYEVQAFTAYLSYPLVVRSKTIGVISFFRIGEYFYLDEAGISRIERYVGAISSAINNANNYKNLKRAHAALNALFDAADATPDGQRSTQLRSTLHTIRDADILND